MGADEVELDLRSIALPSSRIKRTMREEDETQVGEGRGATPGICLRASSSIRLTPPALAYLKPQTHSRSDITS